MLLLQTDRPNGIQCIVYTMVCAMHVGLYNTRDQRTFDKRLCSVEYIAHVSSAIKNSEINVDNSENDCQLLFSVAVLRSIHVPATEEIKTSLCDRQSRPSVKFGCMPVLHAHYECEQIF